LGYRPEPVERLVAEIHAAEDTTLSGELELLEVLPRVLARWGAGEHANEQAAAVCRWLNRVTVDAVVLELISELRRRGYRCALATNQQRHRATFMSNELRYRALFDDCFFSCEMGVVKPDPRYFRAAVARLGLEAATVLFIDDKPTNVESARSVGLRGVCFANSKDGLAHLALREVLRRFGVESGP